MSKRRKRRGKPAKSDKPITLTPSETRAAEAVTIAWMLSVMMTLMCELVSLAALVFGQTRGLVFLAVYLFFTSVVTGVCSLVLAFVTVRVRQTPPPKGIIVFSLVVGSTPLAYMLLNWIW